MVLIVVGSSSKAVTPIMCDSDAVSSPPPVSSLSPQASSPAAESIVEETSPRVSCSPACSPAGASSAAESPCELSPVEDAFVVSSPVEDSPVVPSPANAVGSSAAGGSNTPRSSTPRSTTPEPSDSGSGSSGAASASQAKTADTTDSDTTDSDAGSCSESVASESRKKGAKGAVSASKTVIETFVPNFGSLEDHVRGHDFPAHVRTCGPCKYWKHRWKWSQELTFQNKVSGKREPWLGFHNGAAVCIVCAAYSGPGKRDSFASGSGSFLRVSNLKRHGNATRQQQILLQAGDGPRAGINWTHELALRAWNGHMRLDVSSGGAVSASNSLAISQTEAATERDYSTFLFARTLLETRGSFRDFESWTAAASSGDSGIQVRSRRIAAEHTATLAKYEQLATQRFFARGFGISFAGRRFETSIPSGDRYPALEVSLEFASLR